MPFTPHEHFRAEITAGADDVVTLELRGELDLVSMDDFVTALEAVLSLGPDTLLFDLTRMHFVSLDGFISIGASTERVPVVLVRAVRGGVHPSRILEILGHAIRLVESNEVPLGARRLERRGDVVLFVAPLPPSRNPAER